MIEGKERDRPSGVLRFGMVGGAAGSLIGDVHRKGALFDDQAQLVAGSFSANFERTLHTGERLGLDRERLYGTFEEMAEKEAEREDPIDFVVIVTPNFLHYAAARAFLLQGIHVVCDKPLTLTVEEAEELARLAQEQGLLFCVTYTYSQCAALKQAQLMIKNGEIGDIQVVMAEYSQGWLATDLENQGNKQASWRTDPKRSGVSNCVGDIGTHIEHTISYVTGLEIEALSARLDHFGGNDRPLDTNAVIMLRYTNGAIGSYWCSQVAVGYDNGFMIRIFGTKGTIEWRQEEPNYLDVLKLGQPRQRLSRGNDYLYPEAAAISRLPAGHPEGYCETFANLYLKFTSALLKLKQGSEPSEADSDFPDAADGIRGVRFVHACVESSQLGSTWVEFSPERGSVEEQL